MSYILWTYTWMLQISKFSKCLIFVVHLSRGTWLCIDPAYFSSKESPFIFHTSVFWFMLALICLQTILSWSFSIQGQGSAAPKNSAYFFMCISVFSVFLNEARIKHCIVNKCEPDHDQALSWLSAWPTQSLCKQLQLISLKTSQRHKELAVKYYNCRLYNLT